MCRIPFFFACVAMLVSCGPSKPRADLVFLNSAEPETIDPAMASDQVSMRIGESLFEGLCRINAQGRPEPGVAERWEVTPDKLHYTFHLRSNSFWSDGKPVTAHDFVRAWERVLNPATASEYASQLYPLKGAKDYNDGVLKDFTQVGVHAMDDHTLVCDLANPVPYWVDLTAFLTLAPTPIATVDKYPTTWTRPAHIVGNGPFLLDEWIIDDHIRLKKNPQYWDAANVKMATVEVLPIGDANTALNYFLTGQADLMMDKAHMPPSLQTKLKQQPWFHTGPFLGTWFIRINTTKPPFTDPRVRQAFAMAVDRKRITEKITQLGEHTATSFTPAGAGQNYQPPPGPDFNPQKARALLAEAGFPGGKGFPRVNYLHLTVPIEKFIAIELQAMWKENLGIEVSLDKQEQRIWLDTMRKLKYDLCRSSWVGDYNDPNTFLDCFTSANGQNRTGWASPRYDEYIAAAAREPEIEKRHGIFRDAENLLITQDSVIIPVYHYVGVQFRREKLGGIQPNLIDDHPFRAMFWKP